MPSIQHICRALVLVLPLFLIQCSSDSSRKPLAWRGEVIEQGADKTVRTLEGQVWPLDRYLVPQISIGTSEVGPYLLGRVVDLDADGEFIYLLDVQEPAVKVYDWRGVFVRSVGRSGNGPGEFQRPEQLAVDQKGGRLFVRDYSLQRVNVYTLDGESIDTWRTSSSSQGPGFPMFFTEADRLYTASMSWHSSGPRLFLMSVGPRGSESDTIWVPTIEGEHQTINVGTSWFPLPFGPQFTWTVGGSATVVAGFPDQYSLTLNYPDGSTLTIERASALVEIERAEAVVATLNF